jgi:hypothetical protein
MNVVEIYNMRMDILNIMVIKKDIIWRMSVFGLLENKRVIV